MSKKKPTTWEDSAILARGILNDRVERRKWLLRLLMFPLVMIVIGVWGIHDWIWQSPWRVLLWWGGCAWQPVWCCFLQSTMHWASFAKKGQNHDQILMIDNGASLETHPPRITSCLE
ncbi:MAG: hypothetical protein HC845_07710 [Akkermansiaceae bacterium]|nr:hypothetical protein [Akkermansiaceae bacterium]